MTFIRYPTITFLYLQAKGQFKKQSVANNVEVRVPVPSDADSPKFKTSTGNAKYVPEKNLVVWTIKSFPVRNSQRVVTIADWIAD